MLSQRWNGFLVCSASDKISTYAQPAMKFVPRVLSIFWMSILKWVGISLYAEHARKLFTHWLSMCTKFFTCWLSMHENWLLIGWACAKIGYMLAEHTQKSFWCTMCIFLSYPLSPIPLSPSPVPVPVLCPLSHVFVLCRPSDVPCLMALFLVSRPPSPV
jgi:hypothetical protein